VKKRPTSRSPADQQKKEGRKPNDAELAGSVATIEQVRPKAAKTQRLVHLLQTWLCDESGYDEVTWPQLKKALDQERTNRGARRLVDA